MPLDIAETLARRLGISRERGLPICELLDAGLHPVFIAYYRKAVTAGMDDLALRRLAETRRELLFIEDLRQKARRQAEQAKAMTDELAKAIAEADEPEAIEDLIRPYKPRRRTAALVAQERGLGPLADFLWNATAATAEGVTLIAKAAEFVSPEKEVRSPEEALTGASHILAERVSDDPRVRCAIRALLWDEGVLKSAKAKEGGKNAAEFKGYFQFQEAINRLPPHRVLALNRGERSKALKLTIEVPPEALKEKIFPIVAPAEHPFRAVLDTVVTDALARLVLPAVDREIRRQLTARAESHAIEVFSANLRSLLMAQPIRGKRVLAIQPGFRTGCKVAALDAAGALLGETILYPLEPQKKWSEGKAAILAEIQKHGSELIAIGNGTGCREIEQLVSETIEEAALNVQYAIISEAGAAVYADSDVAKQEFANLDAAIRATISIGRRTQDPLLEFVKIDPRAIGVGLYQHDVNQQRLRAALDETMQSCVAAVGADANTASPSMLAHIPGLDARQVQALLAGRAKAPLATREDLKSLDGWDEAAFRAAAGFLRIHGSNPLDATRVHPESYAIAEKLLASLGHTAAELTAAESAQAIRKRLTGIALEPLAAELSMPLADLTELVGALQNPERDPRAQHHGPVFRSKMQQIEDLAPGMWVKGTVRNVVDFGAFIDIGLKEDGLVHISQFSKRYVRNPLKFLHVGDVVDVRIVSIEADKHRIALTLISEEPKKPQPRPASRRPPTRAAAPEGGAPQPAATGGPETPRGTRRPAAARTGSSAPRAGQGARPASARPSGASTGADVTRRGAPAGQESRGRPPASGGRPAGREGGREGERPRGPRGPRDRRPERTGPPRIVVSKGKPAEASRPPDEKGRPKLRWAYYDSEIGSEAAQEEFVEQAEATEAETAESPAVAPSPAIAPSPAEAAPAAESPAPEAVQAASPEHSPAEPPPVEPAQAEPPQAEPPQAEPPPASPEAAPPPEPPPAAAP